MGRKIFLYEFISGGGLAGESIPNSLLTEGFGMLNSIIDDFSNADFEIFTCLDKRIDDFVSPRKVDVKEIVIDEEDFKEKFEYCVDEVDYSLIIAPETDGILSRLVYTVETKFSKVHLGPSTNAIDLTTNKMETYRVVEENGLNVPITFLVNFHNSTEKLEEISEILDFPLIFKPVDGVGSEGLCFVKNSSQINDSTEIVRKTTRLKHSLVQEYIDGVHGSVSVISNGKDSFPIGLNGQLIDFSKTPSYLGGYTPLENPFKKQALEDAKKAVELIEGSKGYMGVDLVLSKKGPIIMEINPRITTSYIGLKKIVDKNLARVIYDSVEYQKIPAHIRLNGYSFFSKVSLPRLPRNIVQSSKEISLIPEVVSPPFPLSPDEENAVLIASFGRDLVEAENRFGEVRNRILRLFEGYS